jgi:hypothetical protein
VIFLADGQAYEVSEGDYAPVEVSSNPDAPDPVGPNPDPALPALVQEDDGGTNWALVAVVIAVGAVVLAAGGGLVVRNKIRRGKEGSQS